MEEEKNVVIPLGGSTSDGEHVQPSVSTAQSTASADLSSPKQKSGKAQSAGSNEMLQKSGKAPALKSGAGGKSTPDEPKKPGVAMKIFGAIGALLLFLIVVVVIGAGVVLFLATRDEMPSAPEVKSEMSDVIVDSALQLLSEKEISFNSDEVNLFLQVLNEKSAEKTAEHGIEISDLFSVEKSAEKTAEHGIEISDLFSVIANDKATIYCRAKYKGITWPIRAVAKLSFDDPYIIISLESAYVGSLSLPSEMLVTYFGKYAVSDNISIYNGMIYYDTTEFNDKISEVTIKQLGLEVDEIKDNEDENKNAIEHWWNGVKDWFKNWAAGIVSDMIHDVKFKNVTIIDNEIVISVSYAEEKE